MINRKENESRLAYLLRVAIRHISDHASDCLTEYDGTDCDGSCLADELQQELDDLVESEARQHRIAGALGLSKTMPADPMLAPLDGDHWPLPWRNPAEGGTFGTILAANGEPVAQIQPLAVGFEPDIRKRNEWRNLQARRICEVVNATAAADFMAEHMPPPEVEEIPLELCPKCHGRLDSEKQHMTREQRVECRRCNIHAIGETVELARLRLHAVFGPKPFSAHCPRCTHPLTEKAFKSSELPALTVEITCPYCLLQSCGETREEALGFIDYACRPNLFRDEEGGKATAHRWTWRRRNP